MADILNHCRHRPQKRNELRVGERNPTLDPLRGHTVQRIQVHVGPLSGEPKLQREAKTANPSQQSSLTPTDRCQCGTPGRIRTCDLRFRKAVLYPAELRALPESRNL